MTFPAEYLLSVCPCLLALGGLFAFSAGRRGWLKAALTGLGLALPISYAAAKAGFLCFFHSIPCCPAGIFCASKYVYLHEYRKKWKNIYIWKMFRNPFKSKGS